MDFIKDWVIQNFGLSALVLLGLIALAVYVGAWVSKLKKDVSDLPCSDHRGNLDTLTSRINEDSALLHRIEGQVESIGRVELAIGNMNRTLQMLAAGAMPSSGLTQSHSPISLTEKGKEIAEALGLQNVLERNWERVSSIIDGERNPYDIQMEFISELIANYERYVDQDAIESIKRDAFLKGIPLIDYMRMLGVMARDRYFKEHNINIQEVDKNDPALK